MQLLWTWADRNIFNKSVKKTAVVHWLVRVVKWDNKPTKQTTKKTHLLKVHLSVFVMNTFEDWHLLEETQLFKLNSNEWLPWRQGAYLVCQRSIIHNPKICRYWGLNYITLTSNQTPVQWWRQSYYYKQTSIFHFNRDMNLWPTAGHGGESDHHFDTHFWSSLLSSSRDSRCAKPKAL